ncbi:hypothetical protein D9M73_196790 [compost metagenome]
MGSGAEGQARVQQQVHGIRLGGFVPARHYPEAAAEAHRLEVVHPAAFPILVFDALDLVFRQRAAGQQFQVRHQAGFVGVGFEQGEEVGMGPERRGAQVRLEDRLVFGVHEGHRHGAHFKESVFIGFGLFWADGEAYLQPRHGGHL